MRSYYRSGGVTYSQSEIIGMSRVVHAKGWRRVTRAVPSKYHKEPIKRKVYVHEAAPGHMCWSLEEAYYTIVPSVQAFMERETGCLHRRHRPQRHPFKT